MNIPKWFCVAMLLLPASLFAQEKPAGQFGCSQSLRTEFFEHPELKFAESTAPGEIKEWKSHSMISFEGFDAAKYGFTRVEFYRWHSPSSAPGGQEYNSTERLELAIRVVSSHGEHWFKLGDPPQDSEDILNIEAPQDNPAVSAGDANPQGEAATKTDEMSSWLVLEPATPDARLPLFSLKFQNSRSGVYQQETFDNQMLFDLRTGTPKMAKMVTCDLYEPIGGACSAQDAASSASDDLQCAWEEGAKDFRCTMTTPYGAGTAQRDFYLLSEKPAKIAGHESEPIFSGLGELAMRIQENPKSEGQTWIVAGLGTTTLVRRFKDLLPGAEVFVFASPSAAGVRDARLSAVTVRPGAKPTVETISKWAISSQSMEEHPPENFLPVSQQDSFTTRPIEERPGFRAFQLVLAYGGLDGNPVHVVYWVGLEAAGAKLVTSAVRLASNGYMYGGCGQEFHEGSATSIEQKNGAAEATVHAQGAYEFEYTTPYPDGDRVCPWTGTLHWKAGAGFRVRKLSEQCDADYQDLKIKNDGTIEATKAEEPK
jgi:hypothetical protein